MTRDLDERLAEHIAKIDQADPRFVSPSILDLLSIAVELATLRTAPTGKTEPIGYVVVAGPVTHSIGPMQDSFDKAVEIASNFARNNPDTTYTVEPVGASAGSGEPDEVGVCAFSRLPQNELCECNFNTPLSKVEWRHCEHGPRPDATPGPRAEDEG